MLSPPLLDIRRYYVEAFAFVAHDEYDSARASAGAFDVNFNVRGYAEDPNSYVIEMSVSLAQGGYTNDENAPYSINLDLVGYFAFAPEASEETKVRMIHLNGASMLYGVARGFVGQATGAAKHGQYLLPSVNFVEIVQAMAKGQLASSETAGALNAGDLEGAGQAREL